MRQMKNIMKEKFLHPTVPLSSSCWPQTGPPVASSLDFRLQTSWVSTPRDSSPGSPRPAPTTRRNVLLAPTFRRPTANTVKEGNRTLLALLPHGAGERATHFQSPERTGRGPSLPPGCGPGPHIPQHRSAPSPSRARPPQELQPRSGDRPCCWRFSPAPEGTVRGH